MPRAFSPDPAVGVFETLLIVDGYPVELDAHLQRLSRSASELFGSALPLGTRELVHEHARSLPLARLRLTAAPSPAAELSLDVLTRTVTRADVFPSWDWAIELCQFEVPGGLGSHKWADRTALASMESRVGEGRLPLLLDSGGEVLEASRANVFAFAGDVLITPRADGRILPGVARSRAIEAAHSLGIEVREQELTVEQLLAASGVFLTGSVRGLEPVRAVEETQLERPGEAAGGIAEAMKQLWIGRDAASWAEAL